MSRSYNVLTATHIREILLSYDKDVVKSAKLSAGGPADLQATHALLTALGGVQWKVVLGCVQALAHAGPESAKSAVDGLVKCLNHPYPEIRTEAGKSLTALSSRTELPVAPLWEAFLNEEDLYAFFSVGRLLVSLLPRDNSETVDWGPKLHGLLTQILDLRLTNLPLNGVVAERRTPHINVAPSASGLVARLLGRLQSPQAEMPNYPSPAPVRPENRKLLEDKGDRYRDTPKAISLIATIYSRVPADPRERLTLLLELCKMPLASFETSESLVLLAVGLISDTRDKMALLASMWGWGRSYDPTWTGRLALSAALAHPELRLSLFQFLRARQSRIDWTGWAGSLRDASPTELEPLMAATLAAPESELPGWMKLLSQAPVEHIIPALARALGSAEKQMASEALERLLHFGHPVPWLLNDIRSLREKWSEDIAMLQGLDKLMRLAITSRGPLPDGKREPDLIAEWMLEDSAENPFLHGKVLSWQDALQNLKAFYTPGQDLHLITTAFLVKLREPDPVIRPLPAETTGAGMTLLTVGRDGDLLFAGRGRENVFLYLLREQDTDFRRLEPSLPVDELPSPHEVLFDGDCYGWTKVMEKQGEVEGGLSLRKDVSYRLDPEAGTLQANWVGEMQPLETTKLDTSDSILTPLGFQFSSCGGFRVCDSEGLAIRTGMENPIHSQGRAEGSLALHLEVFPSRLCRVYLWHLG